MYRSKVIKKLFPLSLLIIFWSDASAYIDPGTGSLLLQMLLAAIAGAFVTIKLYWYRILKFLGLSKSTELDGAKTDKET